MASSIVHLAITNELTKKIDFTDTNRLKFGAILVDAGIKGEKERNAHLKIFVNEGTKKTYDFDRYRQEFGEKMLSDDLYMGYYLHLVQDALYRQYVYVRHSWNPHKQGNVERLHKDYGIVNQYVINKYQLENDVVIPEDFANEDLNQISEFDLPNFMANLNDYFQPIKEEPIFFFTKEMSDEFINEAIDFCTKEIEKIRSGKPGIDMMEYAWNN
ncbi:hypothetical protein [Pseudobutyrivibrio xylanivorans]|uniref:Zinc dependent phospholipase C family protein n=1 Tax=Pseudobutyrivibrio xylanivorans TaxID=185007 RepID=A0A1G5RSU6_PSEXY|nr:hypothetical protein [Pseudobutyrivibrio xylanivorans]SCZ76880.1 hypothetical protein SAMN02910350_00496 [Pseudobutyrivibrio xylanivorans]